MSFSVLDPDDLLENGVFKEEAFLEKVENFDWLQFADKQVLVRGCSSALIPPWAFMLITGKLAPLAKNVRFGNEHDNLVVFRKKKN